MGKIEVVGSVSAWAGMQEKFWQQVASGSLTRQAFQAFLEHRDPFAGINPSVEAADLGMSSWVGMLKDYWRQVGDGSLSKDRLECLLAGDNPFGPREELVFGWQEFYHQYFGLDADFSKVAIPADPGGFAWVIFILQGLTHAQAVAACRRQFKVWLYTEDLDAAVTRNDRDPAAGSYAIRLRDRVEADEELKNLSVNDLERREMSGITLLERLVLGLKYFSETEEHLDVENITLCSGSRFSDGRVPRVGWYAGRGKLGVGWCHPGNVRSSLRSRQAVS